MITRGVIPAGGFLTGKYRAEAGVEHRALAPVGGKATLQRVVDALREGGIKEIVAVADEKVRERIAGVDRWRQASPTGSANIIQGLRQFPPGEQVLVCPCDLPLLTGDAVRDFLARCDSEADIAAGLVGKAKYEAAYPDAPPSQYLPLADTGPVASSSAFIVRPAILLSEESLLGRCFESRKSQLQLALLLGPQLIWQFATRTLTAQAIARRVERVLNCRANIFEDFAPEFANDIDSLDDYIYARSLVRLPHGDASASA
jgi:GTP:adenosylcobinamide-phosphate guanylyltransferase